LLRHYVGNVAEKCRHFDPAVAAAAAADDDDNNNGEA